MINLKKMTTTLSKLSKNGLLLGVGSILNIIPVYASKSKPINCNPDVKVLKSDWKSIGDDFNQAIEKVKK